LIWCRFDFPFSPSFLSHMPRFWHYPWKKTQQPLNLFSFFIFNPCFIWKNHFKLKRFLNFILLKFFISQI
jgi:hypothetical protein